MPSERFLKLSEDKQERILKAAREEFARVPFEEASINKIIQSAEISRGSFYTYFLDKRDLLHYVFKSEHDRSLRYLKELVVECGGDIWQATERWCESFVELLASDGRLQQASSIIAQSGGALQLEDLVQGSENQREVHAFAEWMLRHTDPACADMHGDVAMMEELITLLAMVVIATLFQLKDGFSDLDEVRRSFRRKLGIIQYGARLRADGCRA